MDLEIHHLAIPHKLNECTKFNLNQLRTTTLKLNHKFDPQYYFLQANVKKYVNEIILRLNSKNSIENNLLKI